MRCSWPSSSPPKAEACRACMRGRVRMRRVSWPDATRGPRPRRRGRAKDCGGGARAARVAAMPALQHTANPRRRRLAAPFAGWLLSVLAWPALALGLGQVEVRSRAGVPLLAEIPIISSDPSELEHLQARLASPDTFR